jgi:hypothetical protein
VCGGDESDTADPTGLGSFYRNSNVRFSDISDGLTHTLLVTERATAKARGIWAGAVNNGVVKCGPNNPATQTATEPAPCLVLVHLHLNNITTDSDGGLDDPGSMHVVGSFVLLGDGSVRFLRNIPADNPDGSYTSDSLILQAFGTRAKGEVVPDDFLN